MDCSPPRSSIHRILQARILEWVDIPFSRGIFPRRESNPGLQHCRQILYHLSPGKHNSFINPPLMNNLLGKVHHYFQHSCKRLFFIGPWRGISYCVSKTALCTPLQAGLPHPFPFRTFPSSRWIPVPTVAFACPALPGEAALSLAFLSLRPRSYLLVLEVVRPLSAAEASPAARLIWIQGGNMA